MVITDPGLNENELRETYQITLPGEGPAGADRVLRNWTKKEYPDVGIGSPRSSSRWTRTGSAPNLQEFPIMTSITPFLWFDNNVPEAVAFYKSVFPNAKVEIVNDFMASFELEGQRFNALNGGPQ